MSSFLRLLTLPLLTLSSAALAQTNFQPGYVLPVAGDTLRGEIDARSEVYNAKAIRFRPAAAAEVAEYQPEQLVGYGFTNGKQYQAQAVTGAVPSKAFMNALVLGQLSLYQYIDVQNRVRYFSRKATEPLQLLAQRDTTITRVSAQTGQPVTTKERQYPLRTVLWSQMADCPTAQVAVKNLELKESQLIKAITAYNTCVGGPVKYAQPARSSKTRFSVLVLGSKSQVDVKEIKGENVSADFKLGGGLGLDFAPAFINPKLTLHLQLLYVQQAFTKQYMVPERDMIVGSEGRINFNVALNSIQVPATLRYTFPRGAVRPYLQAGPMLAVHTKRQADATLTYKRNTGETASDSYTIDMRSYNLGAVLGVGVLLPTRLGDVTLEARGEQTDSVSEAAGRISGKRGVSVIAGFLFGK